MTDFINPNEIGADKVVEAIVDLTGGGADYSFDCTGNTDVDAPGARMLPSRLGRVDDHRRRRGRPGDRHPAVPARHRTGLEGLGVRRRPRPHRRAARSSTGTWTARSTIDPLITHTMPLDDINTAFDLMHAGESIRSRGGVTDAREPGRWSS